MIDESKEERASLYVLGLLEPQEAAQFVQETRVDAELRALVDDLQEVAAAVAHGAPLRIPSPAVWERLLAQVRSESAGERPAPVARGKRSLVPWAIAATLAIIASLLGYERAQLRRELADLRSRDALATLRIATLSSQLEGAKGYGAIAWNGQTQRGVLKLEKMPPLEKNQDYQLWVIDPRYPQPVSGGIVRVDDEGNAKLTFTVEVPISNADKFAISREREGGVPKPEGPIVMMSN